MALTLSLSRSEEHTSELQSPCNLVCRLLLEKKCFTGIISRCANARYASLPCTHARTPRARPPGGPSSLWCSCQVTAICYFLFFFFFTGARPPVTSPFPPPPPLPV